MEAIFFSGLAVFASLSALFFFPINILFSIAVGGLAAVFYAVLTAIILLPAVLGVLYKNIHLLSIRFFRRNMTNRSSTWHYIAEMVVKRPYFYFISSLILLLILGFPFIYAKFGVSDYRIFPEKSESRDFYRTYAKQYNINELTPIILIAQSVSSPILSRDNLYNLYDLVHKTETKSSHQGSQQYCQY